VFSNAFRNIVRPRIRSVERGICPIAAVCTVLFDCPDVKTLNIPVATLTLKLYDVVGHLITIRYIQSIRAFGSDTNLNSTVPYSFNHFGAINI